MTLYRFGSLSRIKKIQPKLFLFIYSWLEQRGKFYFLVKGA